MSRRLLAALLPLAVVAVVLSVHGGAGAGAFRAAKDGPRREIKHDKSPPLRTLAAKVTPKANEIREEHRFREEPGGTEPDSVVQTSSVSAPTAPIAGSGWQGLSANGSLPPDPNAAVGPGHVVEIVNQHFAVYSKTGAVLYGPTDTSTLWTGFGGDCETYDDGDATVVYDRLADRWVIQQFAISGPFTYGTGQYLECVAVSAGPNPTGSWYRYAFGGFGDEFPDYPKLGVWPDGYYTTFNLFAGGEIYDGPEVCAYDRAQMLLGQTASQQCKTVGDPDLNGLLPSDVDGAAPPAGSPNYLLGLSAASGNSLAFYKFHVDWATPANTTLTGSTLSVAPFNLACGGSACVPQKGVRQQLDSLGDRLMYRLVYRNFGDHESLVVTHSVGSGTVTGMRWYEIRDPGGTPSVYQQGTYAPADGKYRWMGSAAMDKNGDIALGYSISSGSMFPSIGYTGRLAGDALGTMTQGENTLKAGTGSQKTYDRWGDYSSMSIDPSDDCTFWYTNQYLPSNGSFNWTTWIGSFQLPGCAGGGGGGGSDDFSIGASPASLTIPKGQAGAVTVSTALTSGSPQTVALSQTGAPSKVTVTFNPASVVAGGTPSASSMTIAVNRKVTNGTYTITVKGTGTSATHTTPVVLTVSGKSKDSN